MAAKYISLAVDALHATMIANLPGELTTVETDEGLGAGELLGSTITFKKGLLPNLNLSPMIMSYAEGGEPFDDREQLFVVDARVALNWKQDVDVEAGQKFVDRYVTAILETIYNNFNLGVSTGKLIEAIPGRVDTAFASIGQTDDSDTRFVAVVDVEVRTDNRGATP